MPMNSFQFHQNSTIYADLAATRPLQWSFNPVSHLLAEDPGSKIPNVVAILQDFDEFLPISSIWPLIQI